MKGNDIENLIERLHGFDGEELRREMTDGLDEWCRRRQRRAQTVRRVVAMLLLLLTTTAIAMTVVPQWRTASHKAELTGQTSAKPQPSAPQPAAAPVDSAKAAPAVAVDYYYAGRSEEGYSVAYGLDTRTLTYTRRVGNRIVSSVMHNVPDSVFFDSLMLASSTDNTDVTPQVSDSMALLATKSVVPCDFQTDASYGDAFYFTIIDSVRQEVSLRGDVSEWMGQRIRYSDTLVLPAVVEYNGKTYTVVALAEGAFAGHNELRAVELPVTVTTVGDMAFAGCTGLGSLTVMNSVPPEAYPASFDRTDARLTLTVPCGSKKAYVNDDEWVYFRNIKENCVNFPDPRRPRIRVIRRD